MASCYLSRPFFRCFTILFFIIFGWIAGGCSGGGDSEGISSQETGAIALDLRIADDEVQRLQRQSDGADFDCAGNGIATVEVIVSNESGDVLALGGPWECEAGAGLISGIEAGTGRKVEALAKDESGAIIFRGEVTDVEVVAGQTTEVGPIILFPVVNRPPVMDEIGSWEVEEGETLEFMISASDPDADNTLDFTANNLPMGAVFDPISRFFEWETGFGDEGVYRVLFRVIDDGNPPLSDSEEVTIAVGDVNRPPELDPIADLTVDEGDLIEFQLNAEDPDEDDILFSAAGLPDGAVFDSEDGIFNWPTTFEDAGNYQVVFTANDDGSPPLGDTAEVRITVGDINRPPRFDQAGPISGGIEGEPIRFQVTAQDPDGDLLSYFADNLPPGADFNTENQTFFWSPGFQDAGTYSVSFTVTDDREPPLSDELEIVITVGDQNRPPVLNAVGDKIVNLAQFDGDGSLSFTITASDPDPGVLDYSANNLPQGILSTATFNPTTQTFNWPVISFSDIGTYDVRFSVADRGTPTLSDFEVISIVITSNNPPFFTSIGDNSVSDGIPTEITGFEGSSLSFLVGASDPDQDILVFSASGLPAGASFDPSTQMFTWQSPLIGAYSIQFRVIDDGEPSLNDTHTVNLSIDLG